MARWFRSHAAKLNSPKVQRLSDAHYRAWDSLLCVACEFGGILPPLSDTAFLLRKREEEAAVLIEALVRAGFFVKTKRGVEPKDWNEWQYKSDVSNERVKRFRERQRNVTPAVTVTPSESEAETETEANTEQKDHSTAAKPGAERRGTRLPEDWQPSAEDRAFAVDLGLDAQEVADEFRDYWHAIPGTRGRKLDWSATYRNRSRELGKKPSQGRGETFDQRRIREAREAIRQ